MRSVLPWLSVAVVSLGSLACSSSTDSGGEPSGGAAGSVSGAAGSGGVSTGGTANGGASAGGTAVGGAGGGIAGMSVGGNATGGSGGGNGGVAGAASGGAGGMSGAAGQGGMGPVAKPSLGCGKAVAAQGSRTITTGGQSGMFNVKVPDGYDGKTPLPLGFGFHGFGNGTCGPTQGECRGFAQLPAITVYMKSIGEGWEQPAVLEQNVTFYRDVLALMKNEYCVDESHVFVAGVSSGGQFIEHLACRFGDELWQVTPVSASVVNAANMGCKGTPPVLVIHGVTDQAGNYGQGVAEMFAKRNGCSASVPAGLAQAKTDMMQAFNEKKDEHVCLDWDGCTKNPVQFCISSQITYDGLTHGWPKIGGTLIGDFQKKL